MSKWTTDHYWYNAEYPINYIWPKEVSYHSPVTGVKKGGMGYNFRLQSGEKTFNSVSDDGFKHLDW